MGQVLVVTIGQLGLQRDFFVLQFFEKLQDGIALNFFNIFHCISGP
jgi:hypothetical protein